MFQGRSWAAGELTIASLWQDVKTEESEEVISKFQLEISTTTTEYEG